MMDLSPNTPAVNNAMRIARGIWRQKRKTHACPKLPRLDGKRALVTGGAAGVGEFISRGLLQRGAEVTIVSRGLTRGTAQIKGANNVAVDLADPQTILRAVNNLDGKPFDIIMCNAGLVSETSVVLPTGVERTFGINVLGHHLLYRLLLKRRMLSEGAKVIITTGDIYISAHACSAYDQFDSTVQAYARSKLGNLWQVAELSKRFPNICPIAVHPGVVASGFSGKPSWRLHHGNS